MGKLSLAVLVAFATLGCNGDKQPGTTDAPATDPDALDPDAVVGTDSSPVDASIDGVAAATTQTMTIGTAGGTLDVEGATVVIPAGALASGVSITLTKTTETAPFGSMASAVYLLSPAGQTFLAPVAFTLHLSAPPPNGYGIVWSKLGIATPTTINDFEFRPITLSGSDVSTTNTHFSKVFGAFLIFA